MARGFREEHDAPRAGYTQHPMPCTKGKEELRWLRILNQSMTTTVH